MEFNIKTKFNVGEAVNLKKPYPTRIQRDVYIILEIEYDQESEKVYYTLDDGFAYESCDLK